MGFKLSKEGGKIQGGDGEIKGSKNPRTLRLNARKSGEKSREIKIKLEGEWREIQGNMGEPRGAKLV